MEKDMKKMKYKFSIIIATKDRLKILEAFLLSLHNSGVLSRKDTEIIIVNNGPNNKKIKKLCESYAVRYIIEEIKGKSFALNKGVKNSKGDFLVFTDDDVIIKNKKWLDELHKPFSKKPLLGYVSGDVMAFNKDNNLVRKWEKKGGLSKGKKSKYFSRKFLSKFKIKPWPLTKICAGANCIVPRKVLNEIGGFNTFFGPGAPIGHGESLLIGYDIIKKGYELYYNPNANVYHKHPEQGLELKKKLYLYGTGDTGIYGYIFMKHFDFRALYWGVIGHPLYTCKKILKSIFKKYPLPPIYPINSLKGSLIGFWKFQILHLFKYRNFCWKPFKKDTSFY